MSCFPAPRAAMAFSLFLGTFGLAGCQVTNTLDQLSQSLNEMNDGLSAYAEERTNDGPELGTASLPAFGVGDAFVFDSGRAIYVTDVEGPLVTWHGGGDYRYVSTADFTGPNLEWSYRDKEDRKRSGTTEIKDGSESIWPLAFDKRVRLSTRSENIDPETGNINSYDQWLTCQVPATETVTVPAGTFDSFVIECSRYYQQWWMQTTKWWYAPEIGFYVKRDRTWNSGQDHSEELIQYGPAPAKIAKSDRKRLDQAVQSALENNLSGDPVVRKDDLTISITPLKTVQTDKGVWCRTYRQTLSARGRHSEQVKSACRTDDGWVAEDKLSGQTG